MDEGRGGVTCHSQWVAELVVGGEGGGEPEVTDYQLTLPTWCHHLLLLFLDLLQFTETQKSIIVQ